MFYILILLHEYGCRYLREFDNSLALHYFYMPIMLHVVYMKYECELTFTSKVCFYYNNHYLLRNVYISFILKASRNFTTISLSDF